MPELRRAVHRALRIGPRDWTDLGVAVVELARARWQLRRHSVRELIELGRRQTALGGFPPGSELVVERVALAIGRAAARVPWRADCWVQAMAAQACLARAGVASDIWIGARQDRGSFEAHAWLRCADRIVTGGKIDGWVPLVTPDRPLP